MSLEQTLLSTPFGGNRDFLGVQPTVIETEL